MIAFRFLSQAGNGAPCERRPTRARFSRRLFMLLWAYWRKMARRRYALAI